MTSKIIRIAVHMRDPEESLGTFISRVNNDIRSINESRVRYVSSVDYHPGDLNNHEIAFVTISESADSEEE